MLPVPKSRREAEETKNDRDERHYDKHQANSVLVLVDRTVGWCKKYNGDDLKRPAIRRD